MTKQCEDKRSTNDYDKFLSDFIEKRVEIDYSKLSELLGNNGVDEFTNYRDDVHLKFEFYGEVKTATLTELILLYRNNTEHSNLLLEQLGIKTDIISFGGNAKVIEIKYKDKVVY